ncbi:hypothetical protein PENSPDRAFT_737026 [Peniophora sp. CONT]|nr:hypothetical protein PENSPDRAFT_737026 [Peniophora sp. CONT]
MSSSTSVPEQRPEQRPQKRQRIDDSDPEVTLLSADDYARAQIGGNALKVEGRGQHDLAGNEPTPTEDTAAPVVAGPGGLEELDVDAAEPPTAPVQSPRSSVWFDDGNCFVLAERSVARVYRGLLECHSPIFKYMLANKCHFTMLNPRTPILTTLGQIRHVEFMLRWTVGERQLDTLSLSDLAACYDLGVNYKIKGLRDSALDLLHARYPPTLATWQEAMLSAPGVASAEHLLVASITAARGDAAIAALALYEALADIGFCRVLDELADLYRSPNVKPQRVERLQKGVIAAYPQLISFQGRTYSKLLDADDCPECTGTLRDPCAEAMRAAVSTFVHNADQIFGFTQPDYAACSECKKFYDRILWKRMKHLYKSLPSFFGLVTADGEGIPEPRTGAAEAFFGEGPHTLVPATIPADDEDDVDLKPLLQMPHVRNLLLYGQAQEDAARALVASAQTQTGA